MKNLLKICLLVLLACSFSFGENQQEYKLSTKECKHFIDLSRKEVKNGNLPLARVYAKKAIQSNAWDKLAWANYDDIISQIADEGDIVDFGTVLEESEGQETPKASGGEAQFEGC